MRDRSKQLLVINTGKKESGQTGLPSQAGTTHIIGGGGLSVNMSDYLLKSIWDKVFEIRTDSQGTEYIFGKLPMVTQYGITMYSGDGVDIPSLASGLPFDGRTIWYNPDTQQIEVIGGTGGGSGEGVSNFWDLSGIPSWITNSKPKYTYSEIEGTPDLTQYALVSQIPSLSGYATESWVNQQNYAIKATTLSGYGITDAYTKTNVDDLLKAYVTLGGTQTITGEKNFTGGLKVNGSPIYYDTEKKYWKLEGDLLVTGGVTMYGSDSSFTPSTIMDAILYDDATLGINSNGQLYVKGGTSGGGIDITALQNYLTSNSYLNVTTGDNRYLKLSGGTINGDFGVLKIKRSDQFASGIGFSNTNGSLGYIGYNEDGSACIWGADKSGRKVIIHSGGGTIESSFGGFEIRRDEPYASTIKYSNASGILGYIGINDDYSPMLWDKSKGVLGVILHSGNINSYNAGSATKLETARTIWGQSFDGTGNVSGTVKTMAGHGLHIAVTDNTYWQSKGIISTSWESGLEDYTDILVPSSVANTAKIRLLKNGNVGIGTPHPQDKLDVEGTIRCYSILPKSVDSYKIGDWGNYYQTAYVNSVYCGANSNNLWLVGGKNANEIGVVIGRNTINNTSNAEICRFNANGLVWAKGVKGDIRTVDTAIELIKNNTESNAVYLGDGTFSPFSASSDLLSLGIRSKRWNGVYLGTDTSAVNTRGVVFCNSSSNQLALIGVNNSGDCGIYSRSSIVLRPGGDSNSDGTIAPKAIGVTISANGDLLVTGGITMYSDQRKKTILNHVELSLKQIADAPLIEHYYNSDDKKTTHVGSIAQYWAEMNDWFCKKDSEGYYTMEIQNAALASAISIARELDRYETKTDKAIKKLKKRICELEEEIERLKSA